MNTYRFVYKEGAGEIEEKKSRFIAHVKPVSTEEEALEFLAKMKKQYWDARHNCFAYVIGESQQLQRCSDDGEPAGTAGRPMLDVLLKEDIHNCIVVVTRYFGGTLLGTGGLVRAYQKSTQAGLENSTILTMQQGIPATIHTDYNGIGKIQYILGKEQIPQIDSRYTDKVEIDVMIPMEQKDALLTEITEGTSGSARFDCQEPVSYALLDGQIIFSQQ